MIGGVRRRRNLWSRGVWSDPCSFLITKVPPLSAAHEAPGLYGESVCFHITRMHQNNNLWIINIMLKWQSLWAYLGYDLQHQEMKHLLDLCEDGTGYTHVTLIAHIVHAVRSTTVACRSVLRDFCLLKSEVVGRLPTQHGRCRVNANSHFVKEWPSSINMHEDARRETVIKVFVFSPR